MTNRNFFKFNEFNNLVKELYPELKFDPKILKDNDFLDLYFNVAWKLKVEMLYDKDIDNAHEIVNKLLPILRLEYLIRL